MLGHRLRKATLGLPKTALGEEGSWDVSILPCSASLIPSVYPIARPDWQL